jgi:hypothetical protein
MSEENTDIGGNSVYYEYDNEAIREAVDYLKEKSADELTELFDSSDPTFDFRCSYDDYRHYFKLEYGLVGGSSIWTIVETDPS